jgi:hypothetical protein
VNVSAPVELIAGNSANSSGLSVVT